MFKLSNLFVILFFGWVHLAESIQNCSDIRIDPSFHAAELFAYLTHPCFYDKQTSPLHGFNQYKTDLINIRLYVYYLKHKPAKNLEFQVQLLVQLRWKDPRLEYATKITKINVITGETSFLDQIWTPQIYLAAARESLFQGGQNKDNAVHILPDGTVLCTSRLTTSVGCWAKLGKFPLDRQKCTLNIDTWKFSSSDLQLQWENESALTLSKEASFLAEYRLIKAVHLTGFEFPEPYHINTRAYNCSSLKVVFSVARNYGFYFMNYYLPSILIVAVSWVTFWEAPDAAPGRCLLGTGTMLTFIALGVEVSKSLPTVSYVRSNDLWFIGCTAFIFCSLAEFAFVNTLWRYGGEVELKKATSKYIIKSSLGVKQNMKPRPRRRSLSCPSSPSGRWENPLKRVVDNELTVKSLSDLEITLPLSELKNRSRETFEISEQLPEPPTTMSYQEIAVWIDKKSRIAFPFCFLVFNFVHWGLLLIS